MIQVKHLSVVYPDKTKALDDINFCLEDGENVALIGANGAGKTSLMLSLVGVISSHGEILVDDIALTKDTLSEIRQRIGMVFQNPDDQLFMPSIYDDIAFGPRNYGVPESEIPAVVDKALSDLHIEHLKTKSSIKMSGGEKRMAAIATVAVMNPSVVLFDEPSAFLDPRARRNLINFLKTMPHTKLIATHDLPFAAEVCDRVIVIKDGIVFAQGDPMELLFDEELMERCGVEAITDFKRT